MKKGERSKILQIIEELTVEERGELFTALLEDDPGEATHSEKNIKIALQAVRAVTAGNAREDAQKRPFRPPTLEEVAAYCRERKNGIDPQEFVDHYSANGWMRGKTKISDWKACVRTWEGKRKNEGRRKGKTLHAAHNHGERRYSDHEEGFVDLLAD